ncbi:hypothetical protein JCM19992_23870 [Thermostilla marina]
MRLARFHAAAFFLTALALTLGCGKGDDTEQAPPPVASTPAPSPATPKPAPAKPKPQAQTEEEEKPKERQIPDDLSQWIKEDFVKARKELDERIFEALPLLAQATVAGSRDAGESLDILSEMITMAPLPEPKKDEKPKAGPYGSGSYGSGSYGSGMSEEEYEEEYSGDSEEAYYEEEYSDSEEEYYEEEYEGEPAEESYGSSYGPPRTPQNPQRSPEESAFELKLLKTAIQGVVAVGNQQAQGILRELLAGTREVEDDRTAVEAVIQGIVEAYTPPYQKLAFELITAPESFRKPPENGPSPRSRPGGSSGYGSSMPPEYALEESEEEYYPEEEEYGSAPGGGYGGNPYGRSQNNRNRPGGPITASELQRLTFELVAPKADENMRMKLLAHLMQPSTPASHRELIGPFLLAPDPKNLPIHLSLLAQASPQDPLAKQVLRYVTEFSAATFRSIIGAFERQAALGNLAGPSEAGGAGSAEPQGGLSLSNLFGAGSNGGQRRPGTARGSHGYPSSEEEYYAQEEEYSSEEEYEESYGEEAYEQAGYGSYGSGSGRTATKPKARELEIQSIPQDVAFSLAPRIWGAPAVNLVQARLSNAGTLEASAPDILLAGTYPFDSVRAKLFAVMKANWEEGPQALIAEGMGNGLSLEPGFLACIKKMPREDHQAAVPVRPPVRRPGVGLRPPVRQPYRGGAPGSGEYEGGEEYYGEGEGPGPSGRNSTGATSPKEAWQQATIAVIREMCKTCKVAADYHATASPQSTEQFAQARPLNLHPDAWVTAEYHLNWPNAELKEKLPDIEFDPMILHYVRIEEKNKPISVLGFYRRQFRNAEQHPLPEGGWLEEFRFVRDAHPRLRSIDIVFTLAKQPTNPQEEVDMVVEILCLEVHSPDPADTVEPNQQALQ